MLVFGTDVSCVKSVRDSVSGVAAKFGRIDILVNNAAIHLGKPFHGEPL